MDKQQTKGVWWQLFWTFFRIGAFTFGGGYAMIPLIQKEIVEQKGWLEEMELLDIVAVAESTPGPIAVNMATFVGHQIGGGIGALCATIGVVIPSFWIIVLVAFFMNQFKNCLYVQYAFNGIRIGVLALMIKACLSMYKACPKHYFSYTVMAIVFVMVAFFKVNVLWMIGLSLVLGMGMNKVIHSNKEGGRQK